MPSNPRVSDLWIATKIKNLEGSADGDDITPWRVTLDAMRDLRDHRRDLAAAQARIAELEADTAEAQAALKQIHEGACLTIDGSRSQDAYRYCLKAVISIADAAIAAQRQKEGSDG